MRPCLSRLQVLPVSGTSKAEADEARIFILTHCLPSSGELRYQLSYAKMLNLFEQNCILGLKLIDLRLHVINESLIASG